MNTDRTVHGYTADKRHIVRYDRAGKWYLEDPAKAVKRQQVSVKVAAWEATAPGGSTRLNLPGGDAFDRHVRRMRNARRISE